MTDTTTTRPGAKASKQPLRRPEDVSVLVVDDEPDVVVFLSSVLEDAGINVHTAYDGDQAEEVLKTEKVDLISLDLVMPRKSGIRLFMELRRTKEWSTIPVIFVTGHANDPDVRRDVGQVLEDKTMMGPSSYLEKPVTPRSYLKHICKTLNVQVPEEDAEASAEDLRRQAKELLNGADADTLQAMLDKLKRSKQ
jgi:CheY-like chemotaxis protein